MTYALIKNTCVINVVEATPEFIDFLTISGSIDSVVDLTGIPTPAIGDKYIAGEFVTGATKAKAIQFRAEQLKNELRTYVDSKFDLATRQNFIVLFILAKEDGLTNRLAYLRPLIDWAKQVISFSAQQLALMQSLATADDVMDFTWSFEELEHTAPSVTLAAAVQILN